MFSRHWLARSRYQWCQRGLDRNYSRWLIIIVRPESQPCSASKELFVYQISVLFGCYKNLIVKKGIIMTSTLIETTMVFLHVDKWIFGLCLKCKVSKFFCFDSVWIRELYNPCFCALTLSPWGGNLMTWTLNYLKTGIYLNFEPILKCPFRGF